MNADWNEGILSEFIDVNPKEVLRKGAVATKIEMADLDSYCRDIHRFSISNYHGGSKFRNGDTIMARITPCLENGKCSQVNILEKDSVGFGSTEFIVFRNKDGISDKDFVYYLICHDTVRSPAVKSMIGTSGRQRVQTDVVKHIFLKIPPLHIQKRISRILSSLDTKIELNNKINKNIQQRLMCFFLDMISNTQSKRNMKLNEISTFNPKYEIKKESVARYIDMSSLSTTSSFPSGYEYKKYNGGMKFKNGDTLIARITPCLENGKAAYINFLDDNEIAFGSTEYIVMHPKHNIPNELLYCIARYNKFVDFAVKNMSGTSGRQRVSAEVLGSWELPCFSKEELNRFEKISSSSYALVRKNFFENQRLSQLRDTLLPKLMTGELDVSNIDL